MRQNPLRYLALAVVALVGAWIVRGAHARDATNWMLIYEPSDVRTLRELVRFVFDLRVPIPPALSAAEILSWQWTGSTALVTEYGYRLLLVGSYLLAVALTPSRPYRLIVTTLTSIVFLAATVEVHRGNPQVADVLLPCTLLVAVACLSSASRSRVWFAAVAGLALALMDLTRPFVVLFLPWLVVGGAVYLSRFGRTAVIAFAAPVLVVAGLWHLHYLVRFGSIVASNHRGYNLERAWFTPRPPLEPEAPPLAQGRWANLNTDTHTRNSNALEAATLRAMQAHPSNAAATAGELLRRYFFPPTNIYLYRPKATWLWGYRLLAGVALGWMVANGAAAIAVGCRDPRRWTEPINLLIVATVCIYLLQALGERGEEARFTLSWLPMLASWPTVR